MEQQYALIVDGVVDNTALATLEVAASFGWKVLLPAGFGRGDIYDAKTGTFSHASAAPVVPASVTMRQAQLALFNAGKLAAVNAAIQAMPGTAGDLARIEWATATTIERKSPLVASMGVVLSWDAAALDQLFLTAATL